MSWYLKRCLQLPLPCLSVFLRKDYFPIIALIILIRLLNANLVYPWLGDHMGCAWANYLTFNKFQGLEASYHHDSNTTERPLPLPLTATLSGCAAARRQKQPGCPSPEAQWKCSTHTMGCIWSRGEMRCPGKLADLESVLREPILIKTATTCSLSYADLQG